jgi:P-loop containing dynein motor region D4
MLCLAQIIDDVRSAAAAVAGLQAPDKLWAFFLRRVRERLHIALAFSPAHPAFAARLRAYPALVSRCAVDWHGAAWPSDALEAVAMKELRTVDLAVRAQSPKRARCFFMKKHEA